MITEGDDVVGSSTNTAPETFGETPFRLEPPPPTVRNANLGEPVQHAPIIMSQSL